MSAATALQGLFHDPCGLEHPYEQEPTERFPRVPVAGESVALGVTTWPPGVAEAVWGIWRIEGSPKEYLAEGHWEQDTKDRSYWRVELPSFGYRDRITYRLCVRQGRKQLSTEDFDFVVADWSPVEAAARYDFGSRQLVLECRVGDPPICLAVSLCFPTSQILHLQLSRPGTELPKSIDCCVRFEVMEATEEHIVLTTEKLKCRILLHPFRFEVYDIDGTSLL
ncbi:MAG: DUF4968 domain-containing protein, partial [Anaerolineae bacterium]|nr:DUF4968 domain-containing protein [Anaerolineae bacterium]